MMASHYQYLISKDTKYIQGKFHDKHEQISGHISNNLLNNLWEGGHL